MSRNPLPLLIAVGTAIRLAIAFEGSAHADLIAFQSVDARLDGGILGVYGINNPDIVDPGGARLRIFWPYPPLYLTWLALASGISDVTGLPFHIAARLLPIAADAAIGFAVYTYLGWRGAAERTRLAGAALVLLGPCFIAVSGYHGQFDQVAILPAVLALMAWERRPAAGRAARAGVLVGLGAAMKTVPGLVALPLAATARSAREAAGLIALVVVVPAILLLPFVVGHPGEVATISEYRGLPGLGGLSLVVDPTHATDWIVGARRVHEYTALAQLLYDNGTLITLVALAALAAFLLRYRPAPIDGAVVLWLTVYVFSPNFFLQYLIWGLPFFIMAGYLREVALLQLALIPSILIFYSLPFEDSMPAAAVIVPSMIGLWLFWVTALATVATRVARRRPRNATAVQPPLVPVKPGSASSIPNLSHGQPG